MQVYHKQALAYIAVPKTGTTAVEQALRPHAMLTMPNRFKHMTAGQFQRRVAPFLKDTLGLEPQLFAVLRAPEDQLRSWYKYRRRPALEGKPEFTGTISFDQFVCDTLQEDSPPHARIGRQLNMLSTKNQGISVQHLIAYEAQPALLEFLQFHFGPKISLTPRNVSPPMKTELEPATRKRLRKARAEEFDLHAQLLDAQGYLAFDSSGTPLASE